MRLVFLLFLTFNLLQAQKTALIIGNGEYNVGYLPNPTKDADLIAKRLRDVGFSVTLKKNVKSAYAMKVAIKKFSDKLKKDDIALVYYSGHGVQFDGKNYLMPIEALVSKGSQLPSEALDLDYLVGGVSGIKLAMLLIDACRDNPYPAFSKSGTRGLVQPTTNDDGGMIISFATQPNKTASDGSGDHSPYALAISENIKKPQSVEQFFKNVGRYVLDKTHRVQKPMLKLSFYDEFAFVKGARKPTVPVVVEPKPTSAKKWITPKDSVCKGNGGELYKGICRADWSSAKAICRASGGRLATKQEFKQVISDCGANTAHADSVWSKNSNDSKYQSCYKDKGFSESLVYWSSTTYAGNSDAAWYVYFSYGSQYYYNKTNSNYVRCVRAGQ